MDEHEKGEVIYLRSCKEKLVEQVFPQLHHKISSSDSWNCHVLLGKIYEDIFLPVAKAQKLTECQGPISISKFKDKVKKKILWPKQNSYRWTFFPRFYFRHLDLLKPHFGVIISNVSVVWSKFYPGYPSFEPPCFLRGWVTNYTVVKDRQFDSRKKNSTFF